MNVILFHTELRQVKVIYFHISYCIHRFISGNVLQSP